VKPAYRPQFFDHIKQVVALERSISSDSWCSARQNFLRHSFPYQAC